MWGFEPHVAKRIYMQMLEEYNIPVIMGDRLLLNQRGVVKRDNRIISSETEGGNIYRGKVFIDATNVGDLFAMVGVSPRIRLVLTIDTLMATMLKGNQSLKGRNTIRRDLCRHWPILSSLCSKTG